MVKIISHNIYSRFMINIILRHTYYLLITSIFVISLFNSCTKSSTCSSNNPPEIQSISATPSAVETGTVSSLACVATDEDGDDLTYSWSASNGEFPLGAAGHTMQWLAPEDSGLYYISVMVNDGRETDEGSISIAVTHPIPGCTDLAACNFNSSATDDDGSCWYPEEYYDCEGNCVHDIDGDLVCDELEISGCIDPVACNYDPLATDGNDVSCWYAEEFYDCYGICLLDSDGDGICDELEIYGCTDPDAENFYPDATEDDGSCEYPSLVIDIDGNIYTTIMIGEQEWMAENLKVTHYQNGDAITSGLYPYEGAYVPYNNDPGNVIVYGYLYNGRAVIEDRGLCPEGWHVPTDLEWIMMEIFLGMSWEETIQTGQRGSVEGGMLKETGIDHWNSPNAGATNESGFTALPGGYYNEDSEQFGGLHADGQFWTSSEESNDMWIRILDYDWSTIGRENIDIRNWRSVRCVED